MGCVSDSTTGLSIRGVSPTSSWGVGQEVNSVPRKHPEAGLLVVNNVVLFAKPNRRQNHRLN